MRGCVGGCKKSKNNYGSYPENILPRAKYAEKDAIRMIKSFYNFPTKCFISVCRRRSCPHRPCRRVLRRSRNSVAVGRRRWCPHRRVLRRSRNSVAVGRRRRCPPNRPCPCRRVLRRSRNSDAVGP